jgi:lysozyme family protein
MRSNFEQCLEWLLKHEGGFVDHPDDPGGMTNKGITAATYGRWLNEVMDVDTEITEELMRNIPDNHVEAIYREEYWNRIAGDKLPPGLDWSIFDWAVNSGTGRAARALQREIGVAADGGIGPVTLAAVAKKDTLELIEGIYQKRQTFYEKLSTFDTFGTGWTRRNEETKEQAISLI